MRIGFHSPYFGYTVGGGEKYLALAAKAVARAHPEHSVEIVGSVPVDRMLYARMLNVDLTGVAVKSTNTRITPLHRLANRAGFLRPLRNRVLAGQAGRLSREYDLFVAMAYGMPAISEARSGVVLCQFPDPAGVPDPGHFQLVICQSNFVRGSVQRYWARDAVVVHPPVDVPANEPNFARKQRTICSVGRFIRTGHCKRQDLMVRAFRAMCNQGLEGWTLHLAGSVHREAGHAGYFEEVAGLAQGYPVELHPDAAYDEVQAIYRDASIYWHAAGFGVDPRAAPERLEHFGMSIAEAMAHGTVPVVFAAGGPLEIVSHGRNGLHWQTEEDLTERTWDLVRKPDRRAELGAAARATSLQFGPLEFERAIVAALAEPISLAAAIDSGRVASGGG